MFHLRTIGLKSSGRVSGVDHLRYRNQLLRPVFSPEGRASLPPGREFCLLAGRIHLLSNVVCVCVYMCIFIFIGDVRDTGLIPRWGTSPGEGNGKALLVGRIHLLINVLCVCVHIYFCSRLLSCYPRSLVREDPTCHGATKTMHHSSRAQRP